MGMKLCGDLDLRLPKRRPLYMRGVSTQAEPMLIEQLRGENTFTLVVTYDAARAEKLCRDFMFYNRNTYVYPAKDILFYYADIRGNETTRQRLDIIKRIYKNEETIIITTIDGLMDKLPDMKYLKNHIISISRYDELDVGKLREELTMLGYESVSMVEQSGQFSVRGGIIDIYPLTEECPCRIELFGDMVDSIRYFSVDTQRSIEEMDGFEIFPASEYILSDRRKQRGISSIRAEAQPIIDTFMKKLQTEQGARLRHAVRDMTEEIMDFNSTTGIDSLVNYFFTDTVSFLDYLPEGTGVYIDSPVKVEESAAAFTKALTMSMQDRLMGGYILPGQADIIFSDADILERLAGMEPVMLSSFDDKPVSLVPAADTEFVTRNIIPYRGDMPALSRDIEKWKQDGCRIIMVASSVASGRKLAETFEEVSAYFTEKRDRVISPGEVVVMTGPLESGFESDELKLIIISEGDILSSRATAKYKRRRKQYDTGSPINVLSDIKVGDYVVHEHHGVGIYHGIEKVRTIEGGEKDYINIEYADNGTLFVPVDQMRYIGKYSGKDGYKPKLNRLGGETWSKTKHRAKQSIDEIVDELVNLYAIRRTMKGYAYGPDTEWQKEFEESFPYVETPDQQKAIDDTKRDMESDRIMDRLICGDVGFGKTEVAIRAAFKAVGESRQVAYLVPTTILAEQHYENFCERMKGYPVEIRMLSRFCSQKEIRQTLADMKTGSVDIVIGTHRLLSEDVEFKNLGLLIIDEEQRFGVKHKEKIKQMKNSVDVLTLTATPIPRTMHMSLIGVRDMSLLTEPPIDRRPIQTYVMEYDAEMVREAINRELARGGQVYYVYNRVDDIQAVAHELESLVPGATVEYAHGKMNERELEDIMHAFIRKEIDVLVSTTIIETGLDIPNVNTIIIHNADNFGLAQLYQLRGRVGRSDRSAYAFLMYRRDKMIKEVAEKRLSAIREFTDLGSGYKISMKDLEIRGAGNILGTAQSGHMAEVGYELFVKMLSTAVKERIGERVEEDFDTHIDLPVEAYIPDSYIRNENRKLEFYKKIASVTSSDDADDIRQEMRDRFGVMPEVVERLISISLLRASAHRAELTDVKYRNGLELTFRTGAKVETEKVPDFLKSYKGRIVLKKMSFIVSDVSSLVQDDMIAKAQSLVEDIYERIIVKDDAAESTDE